MKKYPIGFTAKSENEQNIQISEATRNSDNIKPKKSVVRVYFPSRNMTLSYYNDMFDLHKRKLA